MSLRMEKVNNEIKKRLMEIIQQEVDDPHLGLVSIVRVDTTSDLRQARVFFSVLGSDVSRIEDILNGMKTFIRMSLGKKVRLKILPQLEFIPDDSIKYSVEIYKKIEEVRSEERNERDNKSNRSKQ